MKNLVAQFDVDFNKDSAKQKPLSEDKATIIYWLDHYSKHLFEIDGRPIREVRKEIDQYIKALMTEEPEQLEKTLFNLRQWVTSYRLEEFSHVQGSFDDFKKIVWEFADQLSEESRIESMSDHAVKNNLDQLREAVESNNIDDLRRQSKAFIQFYMRHQSAREERQSKKLVTVRKSLTSVKRQLLQANNLMRMDPLTEANNRRSYDEYIRDRLSWAQLQKENLVLMVCDIDHFKKVNDCYGHDIGDCVIKETVKLLKDAFQTENDFVARLGGEEFAVIIAGQNIDQALPRCQRALEMIRNETFVKDDLSIKFTVSMGVAQWDPGESSDGLFKRADQALYESKQTGRNKISVGARRMKVAV